MSDTPPVDWVPRREFDQRIQSLCRAQEQEIGHLRELIEAHTASVNKEQVTFTLELARRLEELNHAHKTAMENWAHSLPREIFDAVMADWNKRWEQVLKAMSDGQQQAINMADASSRIRKLEEGFPEDAAARIAMLEAEIQSAKGALSLIRWVGLAGATIMLLSFLRMAKVIP